MNTAGFKRDLAACGVRFEEGTRHTKAYFRGKQTTIPRHKELPDTLARMILKQLGLT